MSGNESLRRELEAASTIIFPPAYLAKLDDLKRRFQHSIRVLPEAAGKIARFNCFAYAFGVWDKPRYERLVDQTNNSALMNSGFIMERLDRGELIEIDAAEAQPNDIVVYFAGDQLRHAGRIIAVSDKLTIRSKWGGNEVHEHELWEVPLEHGDQVRFFRPPDPKALLDRLEAAQKPA
jgi:hypothetical protein